MKTETFLILINIILIYNSNKIIKHDSLETYKNFRNLDDPSDSNLGIPPSNSNELLNPSTGPSDLNSDKTSDKPSDSISENNSTQTNKSLLLIVDNYNYNKTNGLLTFLAKFWYENKDNVPKHVNFTINKNNITNSLRFLQNGDQITCNLNERNDNEQIYVYECSYNNYNETRESFEIFYNGDSTEYAKYLLANIKNQTGEIASSNGFIIMNNCLIEDPTKNIINGQTTTQNINNNTEGHLFLNGNQPQSIPITLTKENDTNYEIILNTDSDLKEDLSNKMGVINNNGANKTLLLLFKEGSNTTIDYTPSNSTIPSNRSFNKAYIPKKSSGGLSAGGIVAIILPCIAALLAVLGLAFYLGKSSSGAVAKSTIPMENINMGNNTIGISSSTNVVNKYP
jgi:hypothetical protein